MDPTLDPEYTKILSTQAPQDRPRNDTIDSLQKQIDFHLSEAYRLRSAQNSLVAISRLPAELLSHIFLFVVETGLRGEDTHFAVKTFAFLQVCRRWNEVAVAFPQLWVWWNPGTFNAWHLFKSRSKDVPLFLTWRGVLPELARTVLTELETPKRIRQLDFSGTTHHFECILNALDPRSLSTTSSIRLRILDCVGERLTRFFSLPFPKLSSLDVENFLPSPTSSIFTTSNLTSLKLDILHHYYARSQLSQVLQQNQNLLQLEFKAGGLPLTGDSGGLVPILLPRLVDLRLYGTNEVIDGFVDIVCMSSPLHKIAICFRHDYYHDTEPIVNTTQKLLTAYYGCKELEFRRKVSHLRFSAVDGTISAKNHPTRPTSSLEIRFQGNKNELFEMVIPFFPLDHVYDCTAAGLDLATDAWRRIFMRMESLSHLQLESTHTEPVLDALGSNNGDRPVFPKLKSLFFDDVEFSAEALDKLLGVVAEMRDLDSLAMVWCRVSDLERRVDFEDLVENFFWESVTEHYGTESEEDRCWENDSDEYAYGYLGTFF